MNMVYRYLITRDVDTSSEDYPKTQHRCKFFGGFMKIASPLQLFESAEILLVNKFKNILFV